MFLIIQMCHVDISLNCIKKIVFSLIAEQIYAKYMLHLMLMVSLKSISNLFSSKIIIFWS